MFFLKHTVIFLQTYFMTVFFAKYGWVIFDTKYECVGVQKKDLCAQKKTSWNPKKNFFFQKCVFLFL